MVARVRDPIDDGGRPGPHAPSEVSVLHATNTARHVGQKRRACVHDKVGGGGKEDNIPPPTPSEVMPGYDTSVAFVRGCPSENPD